MSFATLSTEQQIAFIRCADHIVNRCSPNKPLIFSAFAGTGKTYTVRALVSFLAKAGIPVAVLAYVGRAASQLSRDGLTARTIHSLLYQPVLDDEGNILRWERIDPKSVKESAGYGILVDESSMLPRKIYNDLVSIGLPMVLIGDEAQLPSITGQEEEPFCTLTDIPGEKVTLTVPRRQDSESGILELCTHLRTFNSIPRRRRNDLTIFPKRKAMSVQYFRDNEHDIAICGTNRTRKKLNELIRAARGYGGDVPMKGERVMCLKNTVVNGTKINNGELFTVDAININQDICMTYLTSIDNPNKKIIAKVHETTWTTEMPHYRWSELPVFTYGYAVSCHKAQGSTFDDVLFIDEDVSYFLDQQKFRYTACSRAAKKLTIGV